MRKVFLLTVLACVIVLTSYGQKGDKSIGISLGYGTEIKSIGVGAKFNYNITDPIQLSPSFNYFLKKDGVSMWELNADVHYLFPVADNLNVYPLAGLALLGTKTDAGDLYDEFEELGYEVESDSSSSTNIGLNLGGGVSYKLTDNISIGAELKYTLSDFNQLGLSANVTYKF